MDKFYVVDLNFKNGTELKCCVLFNEGDKDSIQDLDIIHNMLSENNPNNIICFQNRCINGKFVYPELDTYKAYKVNKAEF